MQFILLLALLVVVPVLGHCEQGIYRDRDGGYAGSWSGDEYRREYRGRDGSHAGSAYRHGSGWIYRDRTGGFAGSSSGPSDRNPVLEGREDH